MIDTHMSSLSVRCVQLGYRMSPEVPLEVVFQRVDRFMHEMYRLNIS